MKKKKLTSLSLNKQKISQLDGQTGGTGPFTTNVPTMSTCTCVSCLPGQCGPDTFLGCPPQPTLLCTIDCTVDCSFFTCPFPIDREIP
ncbi:hypothetical protein [uncultured Kordia sp.]|uniref:hypothetical protein n=1 Tax=uncultured Kordia sp. TaxID=507699 RepID=UPI00261DC2CA|nr:hypothetical protein [uncultured Kordia sp.]